MRVALTGIASAIYRSASTPGRISACRRTVILYLACSCFATFAAGQSGRGLSSLLFQQQQNAPTDASPAHPQNNVAANLSIPLPEVAARSEDLTRMLRSISNQLPTNEQLEKAKSILDDRSAELSAKAKETEAVVTGTSSALELREEENYWRTEQQGTASLRKQLFDWANAAQSGMQAIQAQLPVWQATLQRNDNTPGLEPTVAVIKQALSDLGRLTAQAQEQLRTIVNLQVRAATQDQIAIDTLDRVNKAREYLDARLLERDSLPLWRLHQRRVLGDANEFYAAASERGLGALNFELHLWVMQESNTSRVKGEVALGVMELLNQAGVEIPFPQRDLRLRAVDPEAAATLIAPNGLKAEYAADADAPNAKFFEKAQRQRAGE